jgi:hypothetical protein
MKHVLLMEFKAKTQNTFAQGDLAAIDGSDW